MYEIILIPPEHNKNANFSIEINQLNFRILSYKGSECVTDSTNIKIEIQSEMKLSLTTACKIIDISSELV